MEAFLFFLELHNPETIEMKYNELKKRIRYVALAATPVPFLDIVANYKLFVSELHRYVQVFGLDKEFVPSVPRLKKCPV